MPTRVQAAGASTTPATIKLPSGTAALVNGVAIQQAQVENVLRASRQPDTPQLRQAIRHDLIARELLRQKAEKQHYNKKPEVQAAVDAAKINAETQLYLKDNIHPEPVTDAQVKARYDSIIASLGQEEYKPRTIVVGDRAAADGVLAKLKAGAAFDALAREVSLAPNKAAGGEVPWMSLKTPLTEGQTQGFPMDVAKAMVALPAGGVSAEPIAAGSQWVILKLDARRPTQVPSFDQAKDTIRQQLQALALEQASAQFVGGLLKGATIQQ
ncbi:peptidyl-prolyl cis-trans isomerase [Paraburkholderia sp. GAS42]|jgi:peptidyl-prolyl cis-trans isomerase C|uniref:peptidylprolyl isomerase n=1 Tax=Paraburkholderia sp. GAS42 TaxID=3035135 RepID=UPI003D1B5465